jgi:hypothetical protein
LASLAGAVSLLMVAAPKAFAVITPTPSNAAGATAIANSFASSPATVTGASYNAVPPSGTPNGTSNSSLTEFPTNGSTFGILTTGNISFADDPNTSGSSGASLGGGAVRGTSDRDVTILRVNLSVPAGRNCLGIDFRFLSEEFPEFVGSGVSDSFVAELDTSNWTTTGGSNPPTAPNNFAFDENGDPISINSTGGTGMSAGQASGTTYDGATRLLSASTPVTPGAHTLYLSIFDQGDNVWDSAVFLDNLRFANVANPQQACQAGAEPAEICDNGKDDDGDGRVDRNDPDCPDGGGGGGGGAPVWEAGHTDPASGCTAKVQSPYLDANQQVTAYTKVFCPRPTRLTVRSRLRSDHRFDRPLFRNITVAEQGCVGAASCAVNLPAGTTFYKLTCPRSSSRTLNQKYFTDIIIYAGNSPPANSPFPQRSRPSTLSPFCAS